MTAAPDTASARAWSLAVAGAVVLVSLALGYGAADLSRASMSASAAKTQAPASQAAGALIEQVVEVVEADDGVYVGRVAVKAGAVYLRTNDTLKFRVFAETPYVMGVPADLHVGAIVHVRGAQEGETVAADRIVILTPNVKLENPPS
ncbi:MAG: hypothetical protein JNK21_11030 [Rhodospirillaceae bacterium]|nr:hypothetical protein [Rhodospirillaceae bacterium]